MATLNDGEQRSSIRTKINASITKTDAMDQGVATTDDVTFASVNGRDVAADGSKLDGIEAGADVTDTANVTAAGALMDSELTSEASVKGLDQGVATTDSPSFAGLTVDTDTLYVDSTDNRVGIGVSAPATALDVNGTITSDGLTVDNNTISMAHTGTTSTLSFTQKVGTQNSVAEIQASRADISTSASNLTFKTNDSTSTNSRMIIANNGDIQFYEDTGTTPKLTWDASAERLGIGTSSPAKKLQISLSDGDGISFGDRSQTGSFGIGMTGGGSFTGNTASIMFDMDGDGTGGITYRTNIDPHIFQTQGSERMRIDSSGNLLVGTTVAAGNKTHISFDPSSQNGMRFSHSSGTYTNSAIVFVNASGVTVGSIKTNGSTTSYNTSSDERLKENITNAQDASAVIDGIQVRQFDWKADGEHQRYGMIAQELDTVAPEAVTKGETEDDMWSVDYSKLVPMLVKEIQDLRKRVEELETSQ
jgi:hypothetical protein